MKTVKFKNKLCLVLKEKCGHDKDKDYLLILYGTIKTIIYGDRTIGWSLSSYNNESNGWEHIIDINV